MILICALEVNNLGTRSDGSFSDKQEEIRMRHDYYAHPRLNQCFIKTHHNAPVLEIP